MYCIAVNTVLLFSDVRTAHGYTSYKATLRFFTFWVLASLNSMVLSVCFCHESITHDRQLTAQQQYKRNQAKLPISAHLPPTPIATAALKVLPCPLQRLPRLPWDQKKKTCSATAVHETEILLLGTNDDLFVVHHQADF